MNVTQKGLTTLLRSAITGEALPLPEGFCLEDTLDLIQSHGIATLVYEGAVHCGISRQGAAMQQLFQSYCRLMLQSEGQVRTLNQVLSRFEEQGIDYMPLKGSKLKALYPKPELRLMGDADILIRQEQYDRIRPVMEALGFQFRTESDHEIIWQNKSLCLELHKRLIPSYNGKFCSFFQEGWGLAETQEGSRYAMPAEEEFLYLITHFTKHYRDGGIGCRHVVDLWVYRRENPQMDTGKLSRGLEELGLLEFYENLQRMMAAWFEDGKEEEKTDFLTEYIFSSGSWGKLERHALAQGVRRQQSSTSVWESRLRYVVQCAFPRRTGLLGQYPILNRHPWLLPGVWIWRLVQKLFTGIRWKNHRNTLQLYTQENLDRQRNLLEYVGLRDQF